MVREINKYGNLVLNKKCVPCLPKEKASFLSEVTDSGSYWSDDVIELVRDLKDTAMSNAANTAGLAAPQIWWKDEPCPAVFVVRTTGQNGEFLFTELINPFVKTSGKTYRNEEVCLSVPKYTCEVKREMNAYVEYQLLEGPDIHKSKLFGKFDFNSFVVQHEYDHLQGKLIKK